MTGFHALLLAAGAGSRFGGRKLLAPWDGEPLVRASARRALAAPVDGVIAVTGCDAPEVEAALADLTDARLRIARAPDWAQGLSASLRRGLLALPPDCRGVVVFLGDMPRVPVGAAARLLDALSAGAPAAEILCDGRPAHPVAYAAALFPELLTLRGDTGGRRLLRDRPGVARIATKDPGAVFDVDRAEDLAARNNDAKRRRFSSPE
ncbi:nucleotidyltransferase family protein [Rubellimicrobium roseum]|uniref:Nucleotidyltransferase family protein n=1 Tax=Rubellimicrobium roseum TaxID=687525 RepID=A0A5C4NDX7_9RHOB|nr:nucleotidyltransferase family protein [Rubellimicrobium roseum]TNC71346.1 nucleotidyltransferase family protein [Rubellimicrobium roseum]